MCEAAAIFRLEPPVGLRFYPDSPLAPCYSAPELITPRYGETMPKRFFTLPLVAALAIGTAALAQDDSETADQDIAPGAAGLDMGEEIAEDPTYVREEYDDWQLKCFRNEAGEDPCQMYQLLTEEAGNPVAEFSVFRLPEAAPAAAGATIVVPLGTLLTEELKIAVDDNKPKSYAFSFCTVAGCVARIGFTETDLEAFRRGAEATLQIVPAQAPDQKVDIRASLKGFTAAFDNASVLQN